MRLVLFFDLPVTSSSLIKEYRDFLKKIKKMGFYMLQESTYVKLVLDIQMGTSMIRNVKSIAPKEGSIMILTVTEKQFAGMSMIGGTSITEIVNNDERYIEI